VFDFGALPPDINSARMYSGPGSGPLLAAAAAWDDLAAQAELFATGYTALISGLYDREWAGAAADAMAASARPFIAWAVTTSADAERAAMQARAAAAAYDAAFAATVPPAVVSGNRSELAVLIATNFLGLNGPAIAANEARYAEMWAQDAAAMYGYAAAASQAVELTGFGNPPALTANRQATAADILRLQGVFTHITTAAQQQLQHLASGGLVSGAQYSGSSPATATSTSAAPTTSALSAVSMLNTLDGPLTVAYQMPYTAFSGGSFYNGLTQSKIQAKDLPKIAVEDALPAGAAQASSGAPASSAGTAAASVGSAESIGGVFVPRSWAAVVEAVPANTSAGISEVASRVLPPWASHSGRPPLANATSADGTTNAPGIARLTTAPGRDRSTAVFRPRDRRYRVPRPTAGG